MIAWIPGTPILLPQVDMNPVRAIVNVTVHFFRGFQLRGFRYECAKSSRSRRADRAELAVAALDKGGNGADVEDVESSSVNRDWDLVAWSADAGASGSTIVVCDRR